MKWYTTPLQAGETREKQGFLLLPKTIMGITRWLERAKWTEQLLWWKRWKWEGIEWIV